MARTRFTAKLRPSGRGGGGHLVEVPAEVVAALGGRGRIPVQASFNGVPYRGSIVRMGGVMMLGVTKAVMVEAGAGPGDAIDVVVENDEAPREVEVPPELRKALKRNGAAAAARSPSSISAIMSSVSSGTAAGSARTPHRMARARRTAGSGANA